MISIVLPSYKGAAILQKQLPPFQEWLDRKQIKNEIVVVDDGSDDGGETRRVARELGCKYFENEINLGKGASVRKGMLHAKGKFRLFTDVDIPFEYEAFERFIHYLDDKEFDVVIGDRNLDNSLYFSEISTARKFGSNIFTFIVGRFITTGLFDTQCGLKGFRDSVAEDLFSAARINSFAFDVELLYISLKRNYDIKRLPVKLRAQEEVSSVSLLKHSPGMVRDIFRIKLNHLKGLYHKKQKK